MPFLTLRTQDFVAALKRLAPKRIAVATRAGELYIGKSAADAVFCIKGALTRCPLVDSDWKGFASVNFGMATSLIKAPPPGEFVTLKSSDGRLRIDTLSLAATWTDTPDWIAAMATEAHLMDIDKPRARCYCPACGKRKGEPVEASARGWPDGLPVAGGLTRAHANRQCAGCAHVWCEVDSP